jgi:predicted nucleic acid-binding protein
VRWRNLAEALQNQEIARETVQRPRVTSVRRGAGQAGTRSLSQPTEMLYISAVILAEIRLDIEGVAESGRRLGRNVWRAPKARPKFRRGMLPVSEGNMLRWRLPIEEGRRNAHRSSKPDLIIGPTAKVYGPALVSSVTSDYEKARVRVVDPWRAAAGF